MFAGRQTKPWISSIKGEFGDLDHAEAVPYMSHAKSTHGMHALGSGLEEAGVLAVPRGNGGSMDAQPALQLSSMSLCASLWLIQSRARVVCPP